MKKFKPIEERPAGWDVITALAVIVILALLLLASVSCGPIDPAAPNPLDSPANTDRTNWHGEAMGHFGPFGNGFNRYAP
jgi:hypothetical protein